MKYNQCPICGANLDPNEKCDCNKVATPKEQKNAQSAFEKARELCRALCRKKA